MRKFFGIFIMLVVLVLLNVNAWAEISSAAVLFLRIAAGARAAGMGEAFVAVADDATASHWNPAGLGQYPLASTWFEIKIPDSLRPLKKVALFKGESGESGFGKYDIWAISINGLIHSSRKKWVDGHVVSVRQDQSAEAVIRHYAGLSGEIDEEVLSSMMQKLGEANNEFPLEKITNLGQSVMKALPEDYRSREDMENAFFALKGAYNNCLVNWENVDRADGFYQKGMKDSVLVDFQADKILTAIEKAKKRFLPEEVTIPFDIHFEGEINDIAADEKFLWVAAESGLYRFNGSNWQRFGLDQGLPTENIKSVKLIDRLVLIGTDTGLVMYKTGGFTHFGPEQGLPHRPVMGVAGQRANKLWVVIDFDLYNFDGTQWRNYATLNKGEGESMESIYANMQIYDHDAEKEAYLSKIKGMNPDWSGVVAQPPAAVVDSVLPSEKMPQLIDSLGIIAALQASQDMSVVPGDTVKQEKMPQLIDSLGVIAALRASQDTLVVPDDTLKKIETPIETPIEAPIKALSDVTIKVPYTAGFESDILSMAVDDYGNLWIGTEFGLIRFTGQRWKRYGYYDLTITKETTVLDFALAKVHGDTARAVRLESNIKTVNHLDSDIIAKGQTIKMFANPNGSRINDMEIYGNRIVFATSNGTTFFDGIWSRYNLRGLGKKHTLQIESRGRDVWYVTRDKIEISAAGRKEITLMHVNWLKELADDMYYEFFGYSQNVEGWGTIGGNITFVTFGDLQYTDELGNAGPIFSAFDVALTLSYGTPLTSTLSGGISAKIIYSNLSKQFGAGKEKGEGTSTGLALDLGLLYKVDPRLTVGMALTNLGPDIAYIDVEQADPLPRNLAIGIAWKMIESEYNSFLITIEANKSLANRGKSIVDEGKDLLADPQGGLKGLLFNPFTMGGMTKEFRGVIINGGLEYSYGSFFFIRGGYIHDEEGAVKTPTLGVGLSYSLFTFDFAYIPSSENLPLANTMRFSLSVGW